MVQLVGASENIFEKKKKLSPTRGSYQTDKRISPPYGLCSGLQLSTSMTSAKYILSVLVMSMRANRLTEIADSWLSLRIIKKKRFYLFCCVINPNPLSITKWHVCQTVCHHN